MGTAKTKQTMKPVYMMVVTVVQTLQTTWIVSTAFATLMVPDTQSKVFFKKSQCFHVAPRVDYFSGITCDATGDGACDDKDNIEQCNYDGGDCCLPIIATDWCIQCICHEDGTKHPDYNSEDECIASWQGDGDCDEKQNTAKCKYDHGDCCLPVIDDKYCFSCICHEDGTKHTTLEEGD